jgi:3-dehydroquinate synthase
MKTLFVDLGETSYPIFISESFDSALAGILDYIVGNEVLVVSNETIAPLYLEQLLTRLASKKVKTVVLPDGEKYKTQNTLDLIYQELLENHLSRKVTLVALGGGVVGDMTGFAAACYQRGVNFIQVPTTLLAQVDSSVGGKTGINHPLGKNMIGAFHQPASVHIGISTLDTLPDREYSAGMAEVIKYGLICDALFFDWLSQNIERLIARDKQALAYAVERSCLNKAKVVGMDEKEAGIRAILNLGHTFGHAIETAQHYQGLLHGEAVAVGMIMASKMSMNLGYIDQAAFDKIFALIEKTGLPLVPPNEMSPAIFMTNMSLDKKVIEGQIRLVLLKSLGEAFVSADYPAEILASTLEECCG